MVKLLKWNYNLININKCDVLYKEIFLEPVKKKSLKNILTNFFKQHQQTKLLRIMFCYKKKFWKENEWKSLFFSTFVLCP